MPSDKPIFHDVKERGGGHADYRTKFLGRQVVRSVA